MDIDINLSFNNEYWNLNFLDSFIWKCTSTMDYLRKQVTDGEERLVQALQRNPDPDMHEQLISRTMRSSDDLTEVIAFRSHLITLYKEATGGQTPPSMARTSGTTNKQAKAEYVKQLLAANKKEHAKAIAANTPPLS